MRLNKLFLRNFGPFKQYEISFIDEENISLLITGKNNEGKSNLILALKLVHAGLKVIGKKKQELRIEYKKVYKLYSQDTENLLIPRLIHNYNDEIAEIVASFKDGLSISVYLDPIESITYADYDGTIPKNVEQIFGFIPYLGMIAEREEYIQNTSHLRASLNTSLAPRHLRNHFAQLLTSDQYSIVQRIVNSSWENIQLLDFTIDKFDNNRIDCYYQEKKFEREISWAGQGLQVWFQIITHLVRLLDTSILILDEPEINLHPEKQNDLIGIIREYFSGSIIIATHSVELMNNVNINHIVHVKKDQSRPQIKSTFERKNLEKIRSHIGSNFNFISSQFETVDYIIFTEDIDDFKIITKLAECFGYCYKIFNIPIHGFSEYKKAVYYKDAYKLLIGKEIKYVIVLDRDYYPDEYLENIKSNLSLEGIKVVFTPGKEIENVFINPQILIELFPEKQKEEFPFFFNSLFTQEERDDALGSFIKLHEDFLPSRMDTKPILKIHKPIFDQKWDDHKTRHNFIAGKKALRSIRQYYKDISKENLSNNLIIDKIVLVNDKTTHKFINDIFAK
ncbi:MAG: hypothetical protein C0397_07155 [Odoribacter sp.]|nr:hypothetical protein [Odoribacter sp.]